MSHKRFIPIVILASLIGTVSAEPSRHISALMQTPASTFDFYLYRLYDQTKCFHFFESPVLEENKPNLCMTNLEYQFDDNLIVMNFFVRENYKHMSGFLNSSEEKKKDILKTIMADLSKDIGVASRDKDNPGFRFGLIQMTPIREGWKTKEFDEYEVREEIANRTVMHLRTNIAGFVYTLTRDQHGKLTYQKGKAR